MGANMIVCWSVKGGSGTTVVSAAAAAARSASIYPDEPHKAQLAAEEEVTIRPLVVDVLRDGYMITATVVAPRTIRWWLIGTTSTLFSLRASVTMHVQEVG
jgi:hypothetical protein